MFLFTTTKAPASSPATHKKKPRPGFAGNLTFLLMAVAMVFLIAYANDTEDYPAYEAEITETVTKRVFTDDDLLFFQDTVTSMLLSWGFNGSVLLAREGEVLVSRSFGFADFRNHTPLAPEMPFQLASISKTFTAAAVLMLQKAGRLHIDDLVVEHIPEFPYPDISIRMLLNHTSGLQNYMWLVERFWRQRHPPNNEDVLQLFLDHPRHLDFRPGTRFAYSNTGYAFLGLLIERISGQSYEEYMHRNIFEPLDMPNTFVYDPRRRLEMTSDRVYGFRRWGRSHIIIPDVHHDGVMGDKGIYSNMFDLFTWDRAISQNKLLPDSVWAMAFEYTHLPNGHPVRYGMGWRLQSYMGKHVVHHPGRWNGFRTSLKRFIEDDATLIILSNNSRDITHLVGRLQNILFYDEITMRQQQPEQEDPEEYEVIGGGGE